MNMWILFEGKVLKEDEIGKIWKAGSNFYCRYTGDIVLIHHYPDTRIGRKILFGLTKLNQFIEQNSIEFHDWSEHSKS